MGDEDNNNSTSYDTKPLIDELNANHKRQKLGVDLHQDMSELVQVCVQSTHENFELQRENEELRQKNEELQKENAQVKKQNTFFIKVVEVSCEVVKEYKETYLTLQSDLNKLQDANDLLTSNNSTLVAVYENNIAVYERLKREYDELLARNDAQVTAQSHDSKQTPRQITTQYANAMHANTQNYKKCQIVVQTGAGAPAHMRVQKNYRNYLATKSNPT